jgi:hypothetical protein
MEYYMRCYKSKDEKALTEFYEQMSTDCDLNASRIVWEWLRNAPCFEMF